MLLNILPKEGSYTNLKLLRKLRESLSFSDAENKEIVFHEEGTRITWEKDIEKDVHTGSTMDVIIRDTLKRIDESGKLTEEHISLYEKFLGGEDD